MSQRPRYIGRKH